MWNRIQGESIPRRYCFQIRCLIRIPFPQYILVSIVIFQYNEFIHVYWYSYQSISIQICKFHVKFHTLRALKKKTLSDYIMYLTSISYYYNIQWLYEYQCKKYAIQNAFLSFESAIQSYKLHFRLQWAIMLIPPFYRIYCVKI